MTAEQEAHDQAILDYGQHSAGEWSDAPELRPDGRHDINGHADYSGQLSMDTICRQQGHVVTPATERVRGEDDRRLTYLLREARRQYGRRPS